MALTCALPGEAARSDGAAVTEQSPRREHDVAKVVGVLVGTRWVRADGSENAVIAVPHGAERAVCYGTAESVGGGDGKRNDVQPRPSGDCWRQPRPDRKSTRL